MENVLTAPNSRVRAIGVSNFSTHHLKKLLKVAKVVPACNQVELHPLLPQRKLVAFCKEKGIQIVAHSPLGGGGMRAGEGLLQNAILKDIATKTGTTPATVALSWGVQNGWSVLPKSVGLISHPLKSRKRVLSNMLKISHRPRG